VSCGTANLITTLKFSHDFPEPLKVNLGIVRQVRPPMLLFTFFLIPSLIILLQNIHFNVSLNIEALSLEKPILALNIENYKTFH
jgi:hypothetical protein